MFAGLMLKDSVDDLAARAVDREAEDMKYVLLMYRDPAQTAAMSAAERDLVARKHESLHSELAGSGSCSTGQGLLIRRAPRRSGRVAASRLPRMGRSRKPGYI